MASRPPTAGEQTRICAMISEESLQHVSTPRACLCRELMACSAIQGSSYPPSNFSEPPPFTFCPTFGDGDELGNLYGPDSILRTRAHLGSSERIRKVIRRAMSGLPISESSCLEHIAVLTSYSAIGILGGSVSSCHGLDATPAHPLGNPVGPNCYPHRIFSWLNDVFPHPANELTNGACTSSRLVQAS